MVKEIGQKEVAEREMEGDEGTRVERERKRGGFGVEGEEEEGKLENQ